MDQVLVTRFTQDAIAKSGPNNSLKLIFMLKPKMQTSSLASTAFTTGSFI